MSETQKIAAPSRPRVGFRYVAAVAVIGCAFAGALWVHQADRTVAGYTPTSSSNPFASTDSTIVVHRSWQDPLAILLVAAGVAAALMIVHRPRRSIGRQPVDG